MGYFPVFIIITILISYGIVKQVHHNEKQEFIQRLEQCHQQATLPPQDDIICLADGLSCELQKSHESIKGMLCLTQNYHSGKKLWLTGSRFGQDLQRSAYWYEKLAHKGHPEA